MSLAVTRTVMPVGTVGSWYQARLTHNGAGVAPYTWSVVSGSLAQGLELSADGLVFGIPTAPIVNVSFKAQVTDSAVGQALGVIWYAIIDAPAPDPSNPNAQFQQADFCEF